MPDKGITCRQRYNVECRIMLFSSRPYGTCIIVVSTSHAARIAEKIEDDGVHVDAITAGGWRRCRGRRETDVTDKGEVIFLVSSFSF